MPAEAQAQPAAKPAPPPAAVKAAVINTAVYETTRIPFAKITPSHLNPRKTFDEDKVAEYAESIFTKGLISPITVRPAKGGTFEIVAGETRYRAIKLLIKEKRATEDYPVAAIIRPVSDEELIELALIENLQRQDIPPMEEARGIANLRDKFKLSTGQIAQRIGYTQRFVQERLRMLTHLIPEAVAQLESGHLKIEMARALAAAPKEMQTDLLDDIGFDQFDTVDELRTRIRDELFPVSYAIFDLKKYKGGFIEGDKPGERWFDNHADAEKLQDEAIDALQDKLKAEGSAFVTLVARLYEGEYKKEPKSPNAGAVIEYRNFKVTVHKGLVKTVAHHIATASAARDTRAPKKPAAKADPEDAFMIAHRVHAHVRKTFALQDALMAIPMHGVRVVCATMILEDRFDPCNINIPDGMNRRRGFKDYDGPTASPALQATLAKLLDGCPGVAISKKVGFSHAGKKHAVAVWEWLVGLKDDHLGKLFGALVADQCGSWADDHRPSRLMTDHPATVAVAKTLGLVGNEDAHGLAIKPQDLESLRKPALVGIRQALGAEEEGKDTAAAVKDRIVGMDLTGAVLPTMRFTSDNTAEIADLLKGKPTALRAAKAKKGAK